jgi:hypothetical protein
MRIVENGGAIDGGTMVKHAILLGVLCVAAICPGEASAQGAATAVGGTWDVVMYAPGGTIKERWALQQDRNNRVKGTVKATQGELPLTGTVTGKVIRGYVTDGDARLTLFVTVEGDSMDGTLAAKNGNMLLVRAKRSKSK